MRNILSFVVGSFVILYSGAASPACGSTETTCYQFSNDRLVSSSKCTYSSCANVHGASSIWAMPNGTEMSSGKGDAEYKSGEFLNGRPSKSFIKKSKDGKEKMQCFSASKKGEFLCGKIEESCCV